MNSKKRIIYWSVLYIIAMGISNIIAYRGFHARYGEPQYIKTMLPFLLIMTIGTWICFFRQREKLKIEWADKGKYGIFLIMFIPTLGMAMFFVLKNGSFEHSFLIPLVVTLAVGIAEEMMFRRILFIGLLKEMDFKQALLLSSLIFSLLHSVNIFAGLPFAQMLLQLIMTFLAGMYYAFMYHYTKNIYLMIASHWLWDYLLLSGAAQQFPVFGIVTTVITVLQIVIVVFFFKSKKYQAL